MHNHAVDDRKRSGYFRGLSIKGVPLFIHCSLPVGGLLIALLAGARAQTVPFFCLGYALLIATHEGGHVMAARALGLKVFAVDITGGGGHCRFERPRRVRHSVIVYSAGVLAQLALLGLTLLGVKIFGEPHAPELMSLVLTFTFANSVLIVLNLLPQTSRNGLDSDGRVLWKLLLHTLRGHPHPHPRPFFIPPDQAPVFPPETALLSMPDRIPRGFTQGIEILNDRTTPADLVVALLMQHLQLDRKQALLQMLEIHNRGGLLIPLQTRAHAEEVAAAVTAGARAAGHSLACRAVST